MPTRSQLRRGHLTLETAALDRVQEPSSDFALERRKLIVLDPKEIRLDSDQNFYIRESLPEMQAYLDTGDPSVVDASFLHLCEDVGENDVKQTIIVRSVRTARGNEYYLVAGLRRWFAARVKGKAVPALDAGPISREEAFLIQGRENRTRKGENRVELARHIYRLRTFCGLTLEQTRTEIGPDDDNAYMNNSEISNLTRAGEAIEALPHDDRLAALSSGVLVGRALQAIAKIDDVAERALAIRTYRTAPKRRQPQSAVAVRARHRETRRARTFELSYSKDVLLQDPRAVIEQVGTNLADELDALGTAIAPEHADAIKIVQQLSRSLRRAVTPKAVV